jgi:hypothetical protein
MLDRPTIAEPTLADVVAELRSLRELIEQRIGVAQDSGDELSVPQAARIVGKTEQTIRNWAPHIGYFDARARRFIISKAKLAAYLEARFGSVPVELEH